MGNYPDPPGSINNCKFMHNDGLVECPCIEGLEKLVELLKKYGVGNVWQPGYTKIDRAVINWWPG